MSANKVLFPALFRVCSTAAYQIRHMEFDTPKVFREISAARYQILSERNNIKCASCFSLILDRCEVLYFSLLSAYTDMQRLTPPFYSEAYKSCSNIGAKTLMLSEKIPNPDDRRTFREKSEIILAETEGFAKQARVYRFRSLSQSGSISRALPEIEYICKCTRVCERAERLMYAYSELISYI